MYDIESLYLAASVDDALEALAADERAIAIAGGTDVLVDVRSGKLAGAHLVSIHDLEGELAGVRELDDGTLWIGPATVFADVAASPVVRALAPTIAEACETPGGPQLRVAGTIGGNVCTAATSGDTASTLLAYDAQLDLRSVRGERTVPLAEWYTGPGRCVRERDELLVGIRVPCTCLGGWSGCYLKYGKRRALEIATLGCCCLVRLDEARERLADVRLTFGVAAPTPVRARRAEDALRGATVAEAAERVGELALAETNPRGSWRASREFRLQLIGELSRRALLEAARKGGASV